MFIARLHRAYLQPVVRCISSCRENHLISGFNLRLHEERSDLRASTVAFRHQNHLSGLSHSETLAVWAGKDPGDHPTHSFSNWSHNLGDFWVIHSFSNWSQSWGFPSYPQFLKLVRQSQGFPSFYLDNNLKMNVTMFFWRTTLLSSPALSVPDGTDDHVDSIRNLLTLTAE